MEEKIVLVVKCGLNSGISRGYDLTLTDIDFEEDAVMGPTNNFGDAYMTQRYVFESFTDIIYDPNMMHCFKIDKKVNEKLQKMYDSSHENNCDHTWEKAHTLDRIVDYVDINGKTITSKDTCYRPNNDKTFYLIVLSSAATMPMVTAVQRKYPTNVYGICDSMENAVKLINQIYYDQIVTNVMPKPDTRTHSEVYNSFEKRSPKTILTMDLIMQACDDPYNKAININQLIALIELKARMLGNNGYIGIPNYNAVTNQLRDINDSLSIIAVTEPMARNSKRFCGKFIFTPTHNGTFVIPTEICEAFVSPWDKSRFKIAHPIVNPENSNPTLGISYPSYPSPVLSGETNFKAWDPCNNISEKVNLVDNTTVPADPSTTVFTTPNPPTDDIIDNNDYNDQIDDEDVAD